MDRADASNVSGHANETAEETELDERGEPRSLSWMELVRGAPWQARHSTLRASLVLSSWAGQALPSLPSPSDLMAH